MAFSYDQDLVPKIWDSRFRDSTLSCQSEMTEENNQENEAGSLYVRDQIKDVGRQRHTKATAQLIILSSLCNSFETDLLELAMRPCINTVRIHAMSLEASFSLRIRGNPCQSLVVYPTDREPYQ